eukprot:Em0008g32a
MFIQMRSLCWAFVPNSIAGHPFPLQHPLIQSNHPKLLSMWFQGELANLNLRGIALGPRPEASFTGRKKDVLVVLDTSEQQLSLSLDKLEELAGLTRSCGDSREALPPLPDLHLSQKTPPSCSLGFGAYFNGAWFPGDWQPHQSLPLRSIQWQELFVIVAAASTWDHSGSGLRIHFHCDNLPIIQAWARQSAKHPDLMQLLRTLFLVAAQHSFTIRLCFYSMGVRHYQGFCHAFKLIPVPGTKETITLFAVHLSQSMNPRTMQVYLAAVCFLHHSLGYKSSASRNLMLRLAIRGFQCLRGPIHLRPTRLPLTLEMLGHILKKHDRLMLPTFGFLGFLRVSKFTVKNHTFDPRFRPTSRDISWSREGIHFFIKRSKTDQMGKGTTYLHWAYRGQAHVSSGSNGGL